MPQDPLLTGHAANRIFVALLLTTITIASPPVANGEERPDQALHPLLREIWEYDLTENPLHATRVGDHRFNDRLPEVSLAANARRYKAKKGFVQRLNAILEERLSETDRLNRQIQVLLLENELREHELHADWMPITNREGFHVEFPELRRQVPLRTVKDHENYIERLSGFHEYARGHIELLREGIRHGYTLPSVVLNGYEQPLKAHLLEDPTQTLWYEPFRKLPATFDEPTRARLRSAAAKAIGGSVVAGYRDFLRFMQDEYVPKARDTIAATALPNGREFYQHRIRMFTTLDLTAEQVHETGLNEVKRIRKEMEATKERSGFQGDLDAFLEYLRTDERFYPRSADELLRETALVLKRMDGALPKFFHTLPRTPYGIREIPDYVAPLTTTAYYMPPPGDGTDAGYYYVNTYNLKSRPRYEITALSLHEAVPGHHLQIAFQQELKGLPNFRRYAGFTAYVEGWALYAERLGIEAGFYDDPYDDFGRLTFEMWRACRLVVDTGMHSLGWSREQAIDFMARNSALSLHNIRAEVDRYIAWPGQALGYKIGELKIRSWREQAERSLGDRFDLREFHHVLLSAGAVPLSVLQERVERYIERTRQGDGT